MLVIHDLLFQALGAGGTNVVVIDHVQHHGAGIAGQRADVREGVGHGRHGQTVQSALQTAVGNIGISLNREPPQLYAEIENHHQTHPEAGGRHTHGAAEGQGIVGQTVSPFGGDDAHRHADQHSKRDRIDGQNDGGLHTAADIFKHRLVVIEGFAPVARDNSLHIVHILYDDGVVEAHLLSQGFDIFNFGIFAKDLHRRVAGDDADHKKDQRHDHKQLRYGCKNALDHEFQQCDRSFLTY